MKITRSTLYYRDKNVIFKNIDGVVYLLDPAQATIHTLNLTASFLWKKLNKPKSLKNVAHEMSRVFEVTQTKALADCKEFLTYYNKLGFIKTKK